MLPLLKATYPNLQYINELFEKTDKAIKNNQPGDVLTLFAKIGLRVKHAYLKNDDQLISCVIHHQIALVKSLTTSDRIDYIVLALKLSREQALDVLSMAEYEDQNILAYFILDRMNLPKLAVDYDKNKQDLLPFKNKILANLEKNILQFTKPITQASLVADLTKAAKANDQQKIRYLMKSFKIRLEMLFYKKDALTYAELIHLVTSIKIDESDFAEETMPVHYDALSFDTLMQLITKNTRLKIDWMLIHMTETYLHAREKYDMPYQDILKFRKTVEEQVLKTSASDSKEIVLSTFEVSLTELEDSIKNNVFNKTNTLVLAFKIYCTLSNDILMNQPKRLALHLQQLIEVIYKNSNNEYISKALSGLNIQVPPNQVKAFMGWYALNLLPCDFTYRLSGMGYPEFINFYSALIKKLSQLLGRFVPKTKDLIVLFERACIAQSQASLAIGEINFTVFVQEHYLHQDIAGLSGFIDAFTSYLINMKSKRRNIVLTQLFKIDASTTKLPFKALKEGHRAEVQAILTQIFINLIKPKDIVDTSVSNFHKKILAKLGLDANKMADTKQEPSPTSLLEYENDLEEIIKNSEFDKIEVKRVLRRQLYDYAYDKKDVDLYVNLLESDFQLINGLWSTNHQAETITLMSLKAEATCGIELSKEYLSAEELKLWLLDNENLKHNVIFSQSQNDVWAFKAAVYQQLAKEAKKASKNLSADFHTLRINYLQAIKENDVASLQILDVRLDLVFSESLYLTKDNNQQAITQMAAKITVFLQALAEAYQTNDSNLKLTIQQLFIQLSTLDLETIDTLLKNKQIDLLAYSTINTIINQRLDLDNALNSSNKLLLCAEVAKFTQIQENNAIDLLAIANGKTSSHKQGLLFAPEYLFTTMSATVAEGNFIEFRRLCAELQVLIHDCIIRKDSKQISDIIKNIVALNDRWSKDKKYSPQMSMMLAFNTDRELYEASDLFNLSVLYCTELSSLISKEVNPSTLTDAEKIEFFKAIYNEWDMKAVLDMSTIKSLNQKSLVFDTTLQAIATYALQTNNTATFAELVQRLSDLILKAYQENQLNLVLQRFNLKFEEYKKLLIYLTSNHIKGLQVLLCDYLLKHTQEDFAAKVYTTLDIDKFDLILTDKCKEPFKKDDFEAKFTAFRVIANRKIDLLKLPSLINQMAKSPDLHQLLLKNKPTREDDDCYHRFHEMMLAIWNTHIATHIFCTLKSNYYINTFEVTGDGSVLTVICQYTNETLKDPTLQTKMSQMLNKIHSVYFKKLSTTCPAETMLESLNSALEQSVLFNNDQKESKKTGIVAIQVNIKIGSGGNHAVAAVYNGNTLMLSDSSGYGNFSGMTFYKIGNPYETASVLAELALSTKTPITDTAYKALQKKLKLTPVDSIELDYQVSGNCGFASQAKPIYLGILYYKFYLWARQSGRSQDDSMSLGNHLAQEVGPLIQEAIENRAIDSLGEMPRNLVAHIHQTALYQLKNFKVVDRINQSQCINETDIQQAIGEIKQHIRSLIEQHIPADLRNNLDSRAIDQQAEQLGDLYLNTKVEQSEYREAFNSSIRGLLTSAKGYHRLGFYANKNLYQELQSMSPQSLINASKIL